MWNSPNQRERKQLLPGTGMGVGGETLVFHGYKVTVCDDEKFMEMDSGDHCTT